MAHEHPHHDHHDPHHDHGHHHGHHHGHGHNHGHGHGHAPTSFGGRFALAAVLNAAFIVAEIVFGLQSGSLALLADAGHNFSDVIGLLLAWGAWWLGRGGPRPGFSYGYRGASILAAMANALLLLIAVGGIAYEAVERLSHLSTAIEGGTVMWVAALGIAVNGFTAWLFVGGQSDLNIRAAFAHLAADAVVSAAVVAAGLVMLLTGWTWIDPLLSLGVALVIVWGTWGLLRDSVKLALQGVPSGVDFAAVKASLAALPGVTEVHDLHVWGMSTTEVAMTAHLVMPAGHPGDVFLHNLTRQMATLHGIGHVTIQIEHGDHPCDLAPDTVV